MPEESPPSSSLPFFDFLFETRNTKISDKKIRISSSKYACLLVYDVSDGLTRTSFVSSIQHHTRIENYSIVYCAKMMDLQLSVSLLWLVPATPFQILDSGKIAGKMRAKIFYYYVVDNNSVMYSISSNTISISYKIKKEISS